MKALTRYLFAVSIAGLVTGNLFASATVLNGLPTGDTDTISIQLDPLNGSLDGLAGASVGWGFTVNWTSTQGDQLSFSNSALTFETNPALLANYADFMVQGGPSNLGTLDPGSSPWSQSFDGVSKGVGAYKITTDLGVSTPGAQDTGFVTFNFDVFDINLNYLNSYSYFGPTTAFSVTVDAPAPAAPEPATLLPVALGAALIVVRRIRPRRTSP